MSTHLFAIYKKELSSVLALVLPRKEIHIKDAAIWTRIIKVIRLIPDDLFVLFDEKQSVTIRVGDQMPTKKRYLIGTIESQKTHAPVLPEITLLLPILKKDAFEKVVYAATQLGVTHIVPLVTEKIQREFEGERELHRLHSIMVAAAEQSKNFMFPVIEQPQALPQVLEIHKNILCFDEHGDALSDVMSDVQKRKQDRYVITFGPEGGFSEKEHVLLKKSNSRFCKLTPTILRSCDVGLIGVGVLRSIIS